MAVELRDLEKLAAVETDTEFGRATMREFQSSNRFDAVRASVTWTASGDRWGRVRIWGSAYVVALYEKTQREVSV